MVQEIILVIISYGLGFGTHSFWRRKKRTEAIKALRRDIQNNIGILKFARQHKEIITYLRLERLNILKNNFYTSILSKKMLFGLEATFKLAQDLKELVEKSGSMAKEIKKLGEEMEENEREQEEVITRSSELKENHDGSKNGIEKLIKKNIEFMEEIEKDLHEEIKEMGFWYKVYNFFRSEGGSEDLD